MTPADAALRLETLLAAALRAPDPVAAFAAAAADPALDDAGRAALLAADPDGVRLAALLVVKLRFERLLRGSATAAADFARDPAAFTAAFRRHHLSVPPTAFWPAEEGPLWASEHRDGAAQPEA